MTKQDIIEYVMYTPYNTNRAVLSSMLNQLADGGGGGGPSEFSIAHVDITNELQEQYTVKKCPSVFEGTIYASIDSEEMDGSTFNIILYQGQCRFIVNIENITITTTGSITVDENNPNLAIITGDGTITIS